MPLNFHKFLTLQPHNKTHFAEPLAKVLNIDKILGAGDLLSSIPPVSYDGWELDGTGYGASSLLSLSLEHKDEPHGLLKSIHS